MRFDHNIRVGFVERGVNMRKHFAAAPRRKADGETAFLCVRHIVDEVVGALLDPENFPGVVEVDLPDLRRAHIYLAAVEERSAKLLFQPQKLLV